MLYIYIYIQRSLFFRWPVFALAVDCSTVCLTVCHPLLVLKCWLWLPKWVSSWSAWVCTGCAWGTTPWVALFSCVCTCWSGTMQFSLLINETAVISENSQHNLAQLESSGHVYHVWQQRRVGAALWEERRDGRKINHERDSASQFFMRRPFVLLVRLPSTNKVIARSRKTPARCDQSESCLKRDHQGDRKSCGFSRRRDQTSSTLKNFHANLSQPASSWNEWRAKSIVTIAWGLSCGRIIRFKKKKIGNGPHPHLVARCNLYLFQKPDTLVCKATDEVGFLTLMSNRGFASSLTSVVTRLLWGWRFPWWRHAWWEQNFVMGAV